MKPDYSHITVVLDRSGSMQSIRDDTIGGFNRFLKDQKAQTGTATLSLVQFDSQDPYEVVRDFGPIADTPDLDEHTYVPRASTPLLDALGRGINDLAARLGALAEDARPSKIIFAVVTDGMENASSEFKKTQIEQMIKDRTEKDGWQFVFLSADLAAIGEAAGLGVRAGHRLAFVKDRAGTEAAWQSLSKETSHVRRGFKQMIGFEVDDRQHPDDPDKPKADRRQPPKSSSE